MSTKTKFRVTFEVNGHKPFIWKGLEGIDSYTRAVELFDCLALFDLGKKSDSDIDAIHGSAMIASYKAYRRKHNCNHPDLIEFSQGTIDQWDPETGKWWTVSESGDEEPEYQIGEQEAFNSTKY